MQLMERYQGRYSGWNAKHSRKSIARIAVRVAIRGLRVVCKTGLIKNAKKRSAHRKRREHSRYLA